MTLDETKEYLDALPLAEALFWFIENIGDDDPIRTDVFFYLRERYRRGERGASPAT